MDKILDLTIDASNQPSIEGSFARIAHDLMNKWILKAGSNEYRIAEIEFYYKNEKDNHLDGYTHGHELQKKKETWYFHGSGIDITFGNEDTFGGILLRAIYNINIKNIKEGYVYGPLNLVRELFKNIPDIYAQPISFGLIYDNEQKLSHQKVISARRIGLKKEKDKEYYDKEYRFLIFPEQKHLENKSFAHKINK